MHSYTCLVHYNAAMAKKVAVVLVDDYYECLEVHYPRLRLQEAGFEVKVAGLEKDHVYKSKVRFCCICGYIRMPIPIYC